MIQNQKVVIFLLRLSIAGVFLYAAVASTLRPVEWIGYIPPTVREIFPDKLLLDGFSLYQLILSLWILSGKKAFWAGILSSITLLAIIIANLDILDVLFRDFAIFFASLALSVSSYHKAKGKR